MKTTLSCTFDWNGWRRLRAALSLAAICFGLLAAAQSLAATIWTGPMINFSKAPNADPTLAQNQDRITDNVWITRGFSGGIYNAKLETVYGDGSPAETEWAYGTTANYNTLSYKPWVQWTGGPPGGPPSTVNQPAVLHLISEDIYIDIMFTSWDDGHSAPGGGFSYTRSTPSAVNMPPVVNITSPTNNTALTLPANLNILADAEDPDGAVAGVDFYNGTTLLGSDSSSPYSLAANFFPGTHVLTAVATDLQGLSSTSAPVNLTVSSTPIANPIVERIPKGDITIELQTIADGMNSPLGMAVPDDGSGRMFVYDQAGLVWLVTAEGRSPQPVLDLRLRMVDISGSYDERGLLGLAVHTNFAQFPYLYTYTSEPTSGPADFPTTLPTGVTNNHQSVIAEWRLNPSTANVVDPATRREVLRIDQPQANHNGGTMRFGPDGLLYVSLGDGGAADDQGNGHSEGGNGQDTNNILGSVIRIDVDGSNSANGQYGVPADNPFVAVGGVDEIFAFGLRNPFSFHFDSQSGQLYLGDVGQNKVEEIDIIAKGGNYGWNVKEGTFYFDPNGGGAGYVTEHPVRPVPPGLVDPIAQYDHDDGTAIIGGTVYRGSQIPAMAGRYVFGDWGVFGSPSGRLYYLDAAMTVKELRIGLEDRPLGLYLKGFGEGPDGALYAFASKPQGPTGAGGVMLKFVPAPAAPLAIDLAEVVNGTNFQAGWDGGVGPFALQRKVSLAEPIWMNELVTPGDGATVRARGPSGFFREVDTAGLPALPLTVALSGAMERPANSSTGSGSGILSLSGNTLMFSINYRDLSGPAISAHIHGPTNTLGTASVLINLAPYNGGSFGASGTFSGTIVLTDIQKAYLLSGLTYVNIHTSSNPGGEIRGQIAPVLMQASLLGAYETSNVDTPARGLGTFMLVGTQLTYTVTFEGLKTPATAAHIHGPASLGQDASVMIGLTVPNATSGTMSGTVALTPAQLAAIVDGRTYVNIHTPSHTGGEIRGQIVARPTAIPLTAWISGANERPPLSNTATGLGLFALEGNQLAFNITYSGLGSAATAAHIHGPISTATNASVQVNLQPFHLGAFGISGAFSGVVTLTPEQRAMVLNGQTYFNIHTPGNAAGEARGQIATVLMAAAADGPAERPQVRSTGNALGLFALVGNRLDFNLSYQNLSATATDAHIHGPATASQNAGVLLGFMPFVNGSFGTGGGIYGSTLPTQTTINAIIDRLTYINFHTPTHTSGEIRGQILR